jgi:hypothetical protein
MALVMDLPPRGRIQNKYTYLFHTAIILWGEKAEKPLQGPLEGVGPENQDFLGPEMATNETHVHKITNVPSFFLMALGLNDFVGANPLLGLLEGVGPERATSETSAIWALKKVVMDLPKIKIITFLAM